MQQQEVLELLESVVRPLREKIEHLQKQNEELKTQVGILLNQRSPTRLRSSSRDNNRIPKQEEPKDTRPPSLKKKEDRPAWNCGKVAKPDKGIYRSPPPVERKTQKTGSARPASRDKNGKNSTERHQTEKKEPVQYISFERQAEPKKIMGGQKFNESSSTKEDPHLKDKASINGKNESESAPSQEVSSAGGSHLIQGNAQSVS